MGLAACQSCGYAYYRTSTRTAKRKIYYYRCLGSDDYRYEGGRVCDNKPVRADYLDEVVWTQVTALLADPPWSKASSTAAWPSCARPTRPPPSEPGSNATIPAPPKPFPGSCRPTRKTCSPSTSYGPACPTCEPNKPACRPPSTPSTPS